jgi:hypothetical protein
MILVRGRSNSVTDMLTLNMWGFHLRAISILEQMTNLEVLSLPINDIDTLQPLRGCVRLREWHLRQNSIATFDELRHLQNLSSLRLLTLSGNPVANLPRYRETVVELLPQITKLDESEITDAERRPAAPRRSLPLFPSLPEVEAPERRHREPAREERPRPPARRDQAALTAVLALLPELSADSLSIVLEAIAERARR